MATVTVRARAPAMACVGGPGRLGSVSAGDLLRCSATRGAVASKPFLVPWTVHRASRRKRESRKRKFCTRKRSPLHCGGRGIPGDKAPPLGGQMGAVLGVLLRNYGFTDLPPSLPLPRSDPVTRICESSYRRIGNGCRGELLYEWVAKRKLSVHDGPSLVVHARVHAPCTA